MGRQNNDPKVVGSSIVLLQERFRRLQRLKEKREERELVKLLVDNKSSFSSSKHADFQDPLALGLNLNVKNTPDFRALNRQQPIRSSADFRVSYSFEKTDVDTSLHL
ncbi:Uncharacterized protein Adt_35228 [Abeliophyllum distichum]|uniref:Uncharacterized protein n=1 Tax=Abeliophyllum distichum TaxID=126358 RepID=A0ABD1QE44_9LAMI